MLGSILWRFAVRNRRRLYGRGTIFLDKPIHESDKGAFDIVLDSTHPTCPGDVSKLWAVYGELLGTAEYTIVVPIREPRSRWLAQYYSEVAAVEVEQGKTPSLMRTLQSGINANVMSCLFGVTTAGELDELVESEIFRRIVFIPMWNFDEGVSLLVQQCGWDVRDFAYLPFNEYTGSRVRPRQLSYVLARKPEAGEALARLNVLDTQLYVHAINSTISLMLSDTGAIMRKALYLRVVQTTVNTACATGALSLVSCQWLSCSYGDMLHSADDVPAFFKGYVDYVRKEVWTSFCIQNDTLLHMMNDLPIGSIIEDALVGAERLLPPSEAFTYFVPNRCGENATHTMSRLMQTHGLC